MGKQSIFDKVREWLGGIAFDIFLWSVRMTQDEYLDAVVHESELTKHVMKFIELTNKFFAEKDMTFQDDISAAKRVAIRDFTYWLDEQATQQIVQSATMCKCGAVNYESHKRWCPANTSTSNTNR